MYIRHTDTALKDAIKFSFVQKLWMFSAHGLKFYGDFFVCPNIGPVINVTECATSELPGKAIFATYA
jgi:hypothetical protein